METTNDRLGLLTGAAAKPLMSITEVAKRCGVSRWTIDRFVNKRLIPFIPFGGRRKFDPDEIEKWLRKKTIQEKM